MATYTALAVNDIRSYIWNVLKNENLLVSNDYYVPEFENFLVPIIPSQQIPEFNNLIPGKTYLVYHYDTKRGRENWWITEEDITISIISRDYESINSITNCLFDYFRRFDDSAKDLNSYLSDKSSQFRYHMLYVEDIVSPQPFDREGSMQVGQIKIAYAYSRDLNSSGRFK